MKWSLRIAQIFLLLACASTLSAQSRYKSGYIIDNDGKRSDVAIFDKDWTQSPEDITYRIAGRAEPRKGRIDEVREFKVGDNKFVRFQVKMDVSSQDQENLSENNDPEWQTRTVFLKQIVEGKADLYRFRDPKLELFFFSLDNADVEQLVYKKVRITAANSGRNADVRPAGYAENLFYKSQLAARVSCGDSTASDRMPQYQQSALQKYFERFNACNGEKVVQKDSTSNFSVALTAGWDFATYRYEDIALPSPLGDNNDPGFQVGVAAEFTLPFNNRKWSILAQPTYQSSIGSNPDRYHQSVEIPLGVRHFFYLQSLDLFVNGLVVLDIPIKYEATKAASPLPEAKVTSGIAICAAAGGGIRFKQFTLEGRYYIQRSYTDFYVAQYSKMSVILGYRLARF
jgi:hypothetical protein